ncbi:putative P-type Ca(2+) transporter [Helianthus annuus]|nr:putative P-type Ca(2+) transporter [Helianthus annuus]
MENYLKDFNVPAKHPSEAALKKWRNAVSLVKNHRRRFRHVADLDKRSIHQNRFSKIKEDLRVSFIAVRAMMRFIDAGGQHRNTQEHHQPGAVNVSEISKDPDKLAAVVRNYDMKTLRAVNGADGIAKALNVSINEGVKSSELSTRQETYGFNKYTEKPSKSFLMFVWDALHDLTLIILIVCAIVSIGVGLATEGWPDGIYDGLGILLSILLVVTVTAVSDYKQSLQFRDLDKEKKKISSHVTRDGCRKKVSIYDLVVGETVPLSKEQTEVITDVIEEFAKDALRTLCLAYMDVEGGFDNGNNIPESGYTLIAVFGIKDPLRPGVKEAVEICLAAGITVRMVTGDNINTAKAIAKECGILTDGGLAIEGPEFRTKTADELNEIAPKLQVMARSSPTDKYDLVKHLRGMSEVVAVTGDGTNDAPALHESDIGFAMGIAGTEVAKEQADVIVMDDDFATIVKVAKWGRAVYINIQKFVQFQLTVNIVALMINFVSACITGSAPLTAVQLLWVNLIMDTLGALALATEPPNDGLMQRPPVKRTDSFITKTMWRNIIGQSIYQMAVLFVFNFTGKPILKLHGENATAILNTFIFNTFVFCQVFNEVNSRDMDKLNVFRGMFSSWIFMAVMVATVVFQVIIVEFLGTFASTVPLDWQLWLLSVVIGLVSMPIAVVLKCIPVDKTVVKEQHDGYEILPDGPERV